MEMKDLNAYDMKKLVELYVKERKYFIWMITLEEFYEHYVRRCECCHELTVLEERDVELETRKMWDGKVLSCCSECCEVVDECEEEDSDDCYDEDVHLYID